MKFYKKTVRIFLLSSLASTICMQANADAIDTSMIYDQTSQYILRGGVGMSFLKHKGKSDVKFTNVPTADESTYKDTMKDRKLTDQKSFAPELSFTYMLNDTYGIGTSVSYGKQSTRFEKNTKKNLPKSSKVSFNSTLLTLTGQVFQPISSNANVYGGLGVAYNHNGKGKFNSAAVKEVLGNDKTAKAKMNASGRVGAVAELGVDFYVTSNWLVNASAKYMLAGKQKRTVTYSKGTGTAKQEIKNTINQKSNPFNVSFNVGYRF